MSAGERTDILLELRGVTRRFGAVAAVDGVDLRLPSGEALGIIGPNGAGKSTLLKLIAGGEQPSAGSIVFRGSRLGRLPPHRRARLGIGLARQIPRPFAGLTVSQNLQVGALHSGQRRADLNASVRDILDLTGLAPLADTAARQLGILDLKRLELARALSTRPSLLLADEIAGGLTGADLDAMIELLRSVREHGVSMILVEHVERVIESVVDRVVVLDWGRVLTVGTPEEIATDPEVKSVYLGEGGSVPARIERPRADADVVLAVAGVSAGYGAATVLRSVDLTVRRGEILAVLGANGAGKSTLVRAIGGTVPVHSGTLTFEGRELAGVPAHVRARAGIAHCQEGRKLFADLTVEENLLLGAATRIARRNTDENLSRVRELFPVLLRRASQRTGTLSGGEQQMVAIARALMAEPSLLLLDEVSLGLAPKVIDELYAAIVKISESGVTMVIVEQSVRRCLVVADHAVVLRRGDIAFAGSASELDPGDLDNYYFGDARRPV